MGRQSWQSPLRVWSFLSGFLFKTCKRPEVIRGDTRFVICCKFQCFKTWKGGRIDWARRRLIARSKKNYRMEKNDCLNLASFDHLVIFTASTLRCVWDIFWDMGWFIICVDQFGDWLQNPSELDVKTKLGRPGGQWHPKKCHKKNFPWTPFKKNDWKEGKHLRHILVSVAKGWHHLMLDLAHSKIWRSDRK